MSTPTDQPNRTDEFVQLVSQHQARLYGSVYALVQNAADAEDLVQKTVLTLWRRFDEFEVGTDFGAWAWTTARYEVLNFLKTRRRSRVVFSEAFTNSLADQAAVSETEDADARREALDECVSKQSPRDQQLLQQRYERDRQVKSLAQEMGRSPQSVTNSLRRIRLAIYRCVQQKLAHMEGRS